jgi:inosine-uridine nucleoside N-ribohydrolase
MKSATEESEPQQSADIHTKPQKPVKLIFDTDIGTDIDDSLALLALLNLPKEDVELIGITTVRCHVCRDPEEATRNRKK